MVPWLAIAGRENRQKSMPPLPALSKSLELRAPGMVRWLAFGVRLEEVVQDVQQGQHMLPVATELCLPDITDNHVPDFFAPVLLAQKVASQSRRRDFGQVFVLGDGKHLFFGQAAERDAIFQRDHVRARLLKNRTVAPLQ